MGSYEYIKLIFNRLLSVVTDVDYRRILEMFFGSGGALDPQPNPTQVTEVIT